MSDALFKVDALDAEVHSLRSALAAMTARAEQAERESATRGEELALWKADSLADRDHLIQERELTAHLRARLAALEPVIAAAREVDGSRAVVMLRNPNGANGPWLTVDTKAADRLRAALAGLDAGEEKP